MSPRWGSKPRRTDRLVVGRNVTLTLKLLKNMVMGPDGPDTKNNHAGEASSKLLLAACLLKLLKSDIFFLFPSNAGYLT
jgi:hypothetical protein